MLDLFAGTGSMSKAFSQKGFQTMTVDNNPAMTPDVCADIMEWDYKQFPPGYFDFVHASPPCIMYSRARTTAKTPRNLEQSDRMVQKALEIIDYFSPKLGFTLENPQTGLLKSRDVVRNIPFLDCTYCHYGGPGYKKATRFWTNLHETWSPKRCSKQSPCSFYENGRHPCTAQRGTSKKRDDKPFSVHELHAMPPALCLEIAGAALRHSSGACEPGPVRSSVE